MCQSGICDASGSSLKKIDKQAFYCCENLQEIEIPANVESFGGFCFYGCKSLRTISVPNSVKELGNECSSGCAGLQSVSIPAHKAHPKLRISKRSF